MFILKQTMGNIFSNFVQQLNYGGQLVKTVSRKQGYVFRLAVTTWTQNPFTKLYTSIFLHLPHDLLALLLTLSRLQIYGVFLYVAECSRVPYTLCELRPRCTYLQNAFVSHCISESRQLHLFYLEFIFGFEASSCFNPQVTNVIYIWSTHS